MPKDCSWEVQGAAKKGGAAVTGRHAEQADGDESQHKADLTWVNSEVCWRLPAGLIF